MSGPIIVDTTTLAPGNFKGTRKINDVFNVVVLMITALQASTSAQADRLNFLTNWQSAYTDQMNQIHSFIANNGDSISNLQNTDQSNTRDDLNRINSTYTQEIQANRTSVSDEAKALQSNINSSNDASNNQANLASTLLQELTTILATIFR